MPYNSFLCAFNHKPIRARFKIALLSPADSATIYVAKSFVDKLEK